MFKFNLWDYLRNKLQLHNLDVSHTETYRYIRLLKDNTDFISTQCEDIAQELSLVRMSKIEAKLLKEILELQSAAIETAYSPEQVGQFKLAVRRLIGIVKDLDVEIKIMDDYFPRNFFDFNVYEPTPITTNQIVSEEERAELLVDTLKETIADTGIDTLVPSSTPIIGADGFDQFGTYHDPNHPVAASERE